MIEGNVAPDFFGKDELRLLGLVPVVEAKDDSRSPNWKRSSLGVPGLVPVVEAEDDFRSLDWKLSSSGIPGLVPVVEAEDNSLSSDWKRSPLEVPDLMPVAPFSLALSRAQLLEADGRSVLGITMEKRPSTRIGKMNVRMVRRSWSMRGDRDPVIEQT
ncbi:hypothetical protein C8R42DRAFT_714610 [Lentinula raphanica]|nr:hypothetical protein C8R42DRAFT_714610 [Lentinula raphanica]